MAADALSTFWEENSDRLDTIATAFGSYQPQAVNDTRLRLWLRQFQPSDYEVGLRIVETVDFYASDRVHSLLKELHKDIRTQLATEGFRKLEDIVFVPVGETGESGQEILTRYRNVNRIDKTNARLAQVVELQQLLYDLVSANRTAALVFLDDFVGTGKKVTDFWNDVLSQHISPNQSMYLGVAVACRQGVEKIHAETPLRVIPVHIVQSRYFLETTNRFTAIEKALIAEYCEQVGNPSLGVGKLGLMLAFVHGCPNNVLSILRGSKRQRQWKGILPRYEDLP